MFNISNNKKLLYIPASLVRVKAKTFGRNIVLITDLNYSEDFCFLIYTFKTYGNKVHVPIPCDYMCSIYITVDNPIDIDLDSMLCLFIIIDCLKCKYSKRLKIGIILSIYDKIFYDFIKYIIIIYIFLFLFPNIQVYLNLISIRIIFNRINNIGDIFEIYNWEKK